MSERILAGQGADELFGGYSRYLHTQTLAEDMEKDFQRLPRQLARDQAVAGLFGAYFSLPYMDCRVVAAARAIPARMRIVDGIQEEAAARCCRPAPAGCNCLVREEGHAVRQRGDEGDGEAGCQAGVQEGSGGIFTGRRWQKVMKNSRAIRPSVSFGYPETLGQDLNIPVAAAATRHPLEPAIG